MVTFMKLAFKLSLFLFIFLGIIIVLGQTFGLFIGNGALMASIYDNLSTYAFGIAAIPSVLGFILSYFKDDYKEKTV